MAIDTPTTSTALPRIVSRDEWQAARDALLVKEKAHTRAGDAIAAERRRLPMVELEQAYVLQGEHGPTPLIDVFEGRRQLIIQHFMYGSDWDDGCPGCTFMVDHIDPIATKLHDKDATLVLIARAPIEKLLAYRAKRGWSIPWYSSYETTFNDDFGVTIDGGESQGFSVLLRDGDRIFQTNHVTGRGVEPMLSSLKLLDLTPFGRQEKWEDSPEGWPQS